jgi:AcrR family transcriptional regulator
MRKPPRRTRERILETSLALMNREGAPHVTTADVADEMNISPGNLYYHFRNKDDIIGELYDAFERSVAPLLAAPPAAEVEDLWLLLHLLFERMHEYRFLYRDLPEITSRNHKLAVRVADFLRRLESTVLELSRSLVRNGRMRASERELGALASNATLVSTHWMSWQRVSGAGRGEMNLTVAAYHVLALFAPFMLGDGRALIERLGDEYL